MSQNSSLGIGGRFGLGPIDQISYVVGDLERSLPLYEALYGPFVVSEATMTGCTIRGETADCTLKLAVAQSGSLEIELIEVVDGETTHSEHLRAHGEGLHHVRFRVGDLDVKRSELEAEGFETVFTKRFGPRVAFAYLEAPSAMGGSVIELLELG